MTRVPWATSTRTQRLPSNWSTEIVPYILDRDNHTCYRCGNHATQVDHIHAGDNHATHNLAAICAPCHKTKSAHEGVQARATKRAKLKRRVERHPGLID